jgi:hypothetical protein
VVRPGGNSAQESRLSCLPGWLEDAYGIIPVEWGDHAIRRYGPDAGLMMFFVFEMLDCRSLVVLKVEEVYFNFIRRVCHNTYGILLEFSLLICTLVVVLRDTWFILLGPMFSSY